MELNICYLYPELLNMYGDIGNLTILKYRAESRGITVNIHNHTIGDFFQKNSYDIVIFGGGQDFEMSIVAQDITAAKKQSIQEYIEGDNVFLAICSGYQMLGEYYTDSSGNSIEGLGIFSFHTEGGDTRFTGNISINVDGEVCVGFENHSGRTYIGELSPLGTVIKGFGNNGEDGGEGVKYKNTYCTYLHGPFLSKNPQIADNLIKTALEKKYGEIKLIPLDDDFEFSAKKAIIKRLNKLV